MLTEFETGDFVQMRKPHACGANEWLVTRTGADVKIKGRHCGRVVMLSRQDFERAARKNLGKGGEA